MPQWLRHHLLIVAAATPVLFFQLGSARLWDRDEPRNARCAVEMLERNDWVVPYFNGELRTHKPVLLYWLIMSAYAVFGVNEFAARFWSAALGLGTVLCTYHLGARLFNRQTGLWAAFALAPALMFDVASRAATPDASLIFFVTASLTAYVLFAFPPAERKSHDFRHQGHNVVAEVARLPHAWQAVVVYALVALAVLAKGPVGIVLPVAIIAATLLWSRWFAVDGTLWGKTSRVFHPGQLFLLGWSLRPLTALAMLLLIALPWYAWVGYRTDGEFLTGFLWDHNLRRATETMEGHRGPALLFYPLTLLVGFFPASIFLIPALLEARRMLKPHFGIVFCLTWIIVVVGLFSLAKTKLPSYVTPCYPALAMLVGNLVARWTSGELAISRHWLRASLACYVVVGISVAAAVYFVAQRYLPGEEWLGGIGLVLIAGGIAALVHEVVRRQPTYAAGWTLATGGAFSLLLFGLGPAAADRHQQSHLLLQAVRASGDRQVAALHCLEPSWVFYLGRPIQELPGGIDQAAEFLAAGQGAVILREQDLPKLAENARLNVEVIGQARLFLKNQSLVVVKSAGPVGTARREALPGKRDVQ